MRIVRAGQSAQSREREREEKRGGRKYDSRVVCLFDTASTTKNTTFFFFLLNYISNDVFVEKILNKREIKKMRECYRLKSVDILAPYWLPFTWHTSPTLLVQYLRRSTTRSKYTKLTSIAKSHTSNWKMNDMLRLERTFSFRQACWNKIIEQFFTETEIYSKWKKTLLHH